MPLPLIPLAVAAVSGGGGFLIGTAAGDTFGKLFWALVAAAVLFVLVQVM